MPVRWCDTTCWKKNYLGTFYVRWRPCSWYLFIWCSTFYCSDLLVILVGFLRFCCSGIYSRSTVVDSVRYRSVHSWFVVLRYILVTVVRFVNSVLRSFVRFVHSFSVLIRFEFSTTFTILLYVRSDRSSLILFLPVVDPTVRFLFLPPARYLLFLRSFVRAARIRAFTHAHTYCALHAPCYRARAPATRTRTAHRTHCARTHALRARTAAPPARAAARTARARTRCRTRTRTRHHARRTRTARCTHCHARTRTRARRRCLLWIGLVPGSLGWFRDTIWYIWLHSCSVLPFTFYHYYHHSMMEVPYILMILFCSTVHSMLIGDRPFCSCFIRSWYLRILFLHLLFWWSLFDEYSTFILHSFDDEYRVHCSFTTTIDRCILRYIRFISVPTVLFVHSCSSFVYLFYTGILSSISVPTHSGDTFHSSTIPVIHCSIHWLLLYLHFIYSWCYIHSIPRYILFHVFYLFIRPIDDCCCWHHLIRCHSCSVDTISILIVRYDIYSDYLLFDVVMMMTIPWHSGCIVLPFYHYGISTTDLMQFCLFCSDHLMIPFICSILILPFHILWYHSILFCLFDVFCSVTGDPFWWLMFAILPFHWCSTFIHWLDTLILVMTIDDIPIHSDTILCYSILLFLDTTTTIPTFLMTHSTICLIYIWFTHSYHIHSDDDDTDWCWRHIHFHSWWRWCCSH